MFKSKVTHIDYLQRSDGDYELRLTVPKGYHINELKKEQETANYVEIKKYQKRRSLDANGALWALLQKMAVELGTTKEELYVQKLRDYGQFEYSLVVPEAVERLRRQFRYVEEKGEREVSGKTLKMVLIYFGSSTYTSKEFAHLLDGTIQDAKELGIDFISSEERDLLLEEWEEER